MKRSELKQLIKEEILAEAKKDKSGLPFALAANIEKYGTPRTPKGAKPVDFTKKQEKKVKKTAEKLKKSISEDKKYSQSVLTLLQNREGYDFKIYDEKIKDITKGKYGLIDIIDINKHNLPVKTANSIYTLVNKSNLKEAESTSTNDDNLYDDLPAVDMHIDDNGHMSVSIQAMFHSPDNGKVEVLLNNPDIREKVVKAIQQQSQEMFRSTVHGLAGEPYGLKEDLGNYMFFQNLKSIKQMVDELLKLDEKMVDGILASGHDWAEDHIATSKDDVEEVHNFLMTKKVVGPVGMDEKKLSPKQKKIAAAAPPEDKITGADFKALKKK